MKLTDINRYQALAIHMVISLIIFFILLIFITQFWYSGILFDAGNGWKAIGMIVGIDLILGPLLTLIVFNHDKNTLKLDLAIIALVQTAALIYGTWTIYQTRPIALAFINTSFSTIFANSEWANDINKNIEDNNTNIFFYAFNDENRSASLTADKLKPYSLHSNTVLTIESPYKEYEPEKNSGTASYLLIRLDALTTKNKYIKIDIADGSVIDYVQN